MNHSRRAFFVLLLAVLAATTIGCRSEQPQSNLPTVSMQLGNQQFTLEVAATQEARERGLMRRDSMPADHGMIFVFRQPQTLSFFMKNTRIPLDIVYLDENGAVVTIKQMRPYDLTSVSSDKPAKWAIELNQGTAAKVGVSVGQVVKIPEGASRSQD